MIVLDSQEQIGDVISLRDIAGHKQSSETLAAIMPG
jgi:hypothetical protein